MIDRATIDRIMDAADIVDVVSEFVSLRKVGANYKGLCPFHDDTTPSFYVSPSRGICHCFSCGKTTNSVGFVMEREQMTYPEALRWLANKYHIEIRERELSDEEKREQNDRESMFIVNEWAADYFSDVLLNDVDGRAVGMQYFRSRGFRDDIIQKFRLGFALSSRTALSSAATSKGYKEEYLVKTGLCYRRDGGELSDRYAGRVIFPWINVSGKVCAFGGRLLDSRTKGVQQKYVNSPDSDIYHKERELYGIYQAKRAIAKEDLVYMVEGYTDVISMHQCGIENVVANSGTALSVHQIRILRRFTANIVLLYDGDAAGIHAAMRGTDMLLAEGMNVKVLLLPDGEDPDSFARNHSASGFREYIEEHQTDFIEFKTNIMLRGVTDPIKRSEAINSIVKSVSVINDQIVRATYIKDCAHRLGINEATLISTMNKFIRSGKEEKRKETAREEARTADKPHEPLRPATPDVQASKVEYMLVQAVVRHGEMTIYRNVETEDGGTIDLNVAQYISYDLGADGLSFHSEEYNRILAEAVEHSADADFKAEAYFTRHPDIGISTIAAEMAADRFQLSKSMQVQEDEDSLRNRVVHMVLDFRMDYVKTRLGRLREEMALAASDMEKLMPLMKEYTEVQNLRNRIAKELGNEIIV
ncbi:DNA primase [Xylanibacter caecicola]|uniref:DNA primase n=1 Tax=Xylanibacter caecicola TaxID=2736294 RepID=UPI002583E875|nr:DNA primase [Xylanibacter caecicola]